MGPNNLMDLGSFFRGRPKPTDNFDLSSGRGLLGLITIFSNLLFDENISDFGENIFEYNFQNSFICQLLTSFPACDALFEKTLFF